MKTAWMILLPLVFATALPLRAAEAVIDTVELPSAGSPLVAVRLVFKVGSIHDPAGKEGLATLTALMVGEASTAKRSYAALKDALYPLAAAIQSQTDREVTVFAGEVHRDTLAAYTDILTEALLTPGFTESDFARNKDQLVSYLTSTLRASNDELLGLEAIQQKIWQGRAYGHAPAGTVQGLAAITLDDVKGFYRRYYTRANLMLGVAGGYPPDYATQLKTRLAALPAGTAGGDRVDLGPLPQASGRRFTLIEKQANAVGIHLGFTLPVTRADADFYPLMIANSYLGEHRTFNGRLMQRLRGARGLNYGDYSYAEHYANGPFVQLPTPNVPRRQQYFSIWIRPVVPTTAHFALRNGLFELEQLVQKGMSKEDFELTREYLLNYTKLWAQTLSRRLGFRMDSRFYGMGDWFEEIDKRLQAVTLEQVNAAIKKYLTPDRYEAVLITADGAALAATLQSEAPSPMTYNSEMPQDVKDEDLIIQKLAVRPTEIEVVKIGTVFEK